MTGHALAAAFEELRPRLLGVAYSITGSLADAEDVVQDAWLRLDRADADAVRDLRAWLVTVVTRRALDVLGSAHARRERYVGEWLPEPIVHAAATGAGVSADPADRITLDESVSLALLRMLEALSPAERTAFVLHDVFGHPFADVAEIVGRSPDAVRQLAARARRHVEAGRPRHPVTPDEQRAVVAAFAAAAVEGDIERLVTLLEADAVVHSDGGGAVSASRKPVAGAERIARMMVALARKRAGRIRASFVDVNGRPGILLEADGERTVMAFALDGGRITEIDMVRNPAKLTRVPALEAG